MTNNGLAAECRPGAVRNGHYGRRLLTIRLPDEESRVRLQSPFDVYEVGCQSPNVPKPEPRVGADPCDEAGATVTVYGVQHVCLPSLTHGGESGTRVLEYGENHSSRRRPANQSARRRPPECRPAANRPADRIRYLGVRVSYLRTFAVVPITRSQRISVFVFCSARTPPGSALRQSTTCRAKARKMLSGVVRVEHRLREFNTRRSVRTEEVARKTTELPVRTSKNGMRPPPFGITPKTPWPRAPSQCRYM